MSATQTAPDELQRQSPSEAPDEPYTPLYEDLNRLGAYLQGHVPSHIPAMHELAGQVGAIVAYLEHGFSILSAARELADQSGAERNESISSVLTQNEPAPVIGEGGASDAANVRVQRQQAAELKTLREQVARLANAVNQNVVDSLPQDGILTSPSGKTAPDPSYVPPATAPEPGRWGASSPSSPAGAPSSSFPTTGDPNVPASPATTTTPDETVRTPVTPSSPATPDQEGAA